MITICTPTYNRAATLPKLYESIVLQQRTDIEWLIVDDGSSDETRTFVEGIARTATFRIRYHHQRNGGRHRALNAGIARAEGEYLIIMDSDDWLAPGALRALERGWDQAPADCCAVVGLCEDQHGNLIGTRFPSDIYISDFEAVRSVARVSGDKKELFRTELLKACPFPEFDGEKRVPTSLVLHRLARNCRAVFINVVVCGKEYRPDGLTANLRGIRARSPRGSALRYAEYVQFFPDRPARARLRAYANYWRYRLHGRGNVAARVSPTPLALVGALLGASLFVNDRIRGIR